MRRKKFDEKYLVSYKMGRTILGGMQKMYKFPNGLEVSILYGKELHFYGFYSEICTLKDNGIFEDPIVVYSKKEEFKILKNILKYRDNYAVCY